MDIMIGHRIAKPVETQAQCEAYAVAAQAVNAHNAACKVGETLWCMAEKEDCYEVAAGGTLTEPKSETVERIPTNAELAAQLTDLQLALCELYEGGDI